MVEGTLVRDHMLKMMGYLNELDILGAIMDAETQIDIVMSFLYLQKSNKKNAFLAEGNVPLAPKPKGKGKGRAKGQGSKKNKSVVKNKKNFKKKKSTKGNDRCFHCEKSGYWKWNCRSYLATKQGNKPTSGATSHIGNSLQGFRKIKRLSEGELILQVGTEATVAVQAVGDYILTFSGDYLILKDCLYKNSLIVGGTMIHGLYLINALENVSNVENILSVDIPNLKMARDTFKEFKNEVENQLNKKIKTLRSDRGGEYLSDEFKDYLKKNRMVSQWTPPSTPELNGVSERRNRTLLGMVRSMMSFAHNATFLEEEFIQDASRNDRIALEEQRKNPMERYKEVEQVPSKPIPTLRHSSREVRQPDRLVYVGEINTEDTVIEFGFTQNVDEACVYKKVSGSTVKFLVLYVDDILLIGNEVGMLTSTKLWLSSTFAMKDLREASYILGLRLFRDRKNRKLGLSQETYINKILARLSKKMSPKTPEDKQVMNNIPYALAVGSLMYAIVCTRPDICHSVSVVSKYQSDLSLEHWTTVKHIFKYLRRTKHYCLVYGEDELVISGFTDADFQSDVDDMKSSSGFVFTLANGAMS
ncbi:uncharacterized protein LOC143857048 [Tasmannia lanceolata]|uniref:uncharacterized protein LOC143857048 n=1 Tax=Tasmannia lanceolata TaxID=3420 RepID=UPI0040639A15